jgi:hypothetical protein
VARACATPYRLKNIPPLRRPPPRPLSKSQNTFILPPSLQTNLAHLIFKTPETLHTLEGKGVAVEGIESLRWTRTTRVFVKRALNICRHVHRLDVYGAESGALRRRAGGDYTEDGVSSTPRVFVASDDLRQHSSAGDEAGEKKKIELHDFL